MIRRSSFYWQTTALFFVFATLFIVSCIEEQDELVVTGTETTVVTGTQTGDASVRFFGAITDPAGQPIADVTVSAGANNTTTDEKGLWALTANVVQTKGHVTFTHPSYVSSSRTVYARDGNTYEVDAQLLSRTLVQSLNAATGGVVSVANSEASITFGPSAFAKTDGTPVASGTVTVVAHYLDPTLPETYLQMPGRLLGRPTNAANAEERRALITYGMLAVELYNSNGESLNLADGQTALLNFPVPAEIRSQAPDEIPLWFFDEAEALWVEEGSATLIDGDHYEGEVSHFTFWNCDIPVETVTLCGRVTFQDNSLAAGSREFTGTQQARLTHPTLGTRYADIGEDGTFCGYIPANEILSFAIEGACGDDLYAQSVGPFSTDALLSDIAIDAGDVGVAHLSGTPSCNGQAITEGYIQVVQEGEVLKRKALDGSPIEMVIEYCTRDGEAVVEVVDFEQLQQSTYIYERTSPLNLDTVEACGGIPLDRYVVVRVDEETFYATSDFLWIGTNLSTPADTTSFLLFSPIDPNGFPGELSLFFKHDVPGFIGVGEYGFDEKHTLGIHEASSGDRRLRVSLESARISYSVVDTTSLFNRPYETVEGRILPVSVLDSISGRQVEVEVLLRL